MFDLTTLEDLSLLSESIDLECKLAQGQNGQGEIPMPRIYRGWKSQHWRPPALAEKDEPEQTLLALQMADLLPENVLTELRARFGAQFDALDYMGRLILATAAMERVVSHNRLLELCDAHSHDLSLLLARLVKQGLLASDGRSRGTVYYLPGEALPTPEQVFMGPIFPSVQVRGIGGSSEYSEGSSEYSGVSSEYSEPYQEHHDPDAGPRDHTGRLISPLLDAPVVDNLGALTLHLRQSLEQLAKEARDGRVDRDEMKKIICSVCRGQYVTRATLAKLLNRSPDGLRQQHISPMVKAGLLRLAFPSQPTHEQQAYRTSDASSREP